MFVFTKRVVLVDGICAAGGQWGTINLFPRSRHDQRLSRSSPIVSVQKTRRADTPRLRRVGRLPRKQFDAGLCGAFPLELRMPLTPAEKAPTSTLASYTDQALLNPWPLYRELREMGPA